MPPAVLHFALNPVTGPWSVMRELARAQAESGRYAAVALGVTSDHTWPPQYAKEVEGTDLAFYQSRTPKMFGTAQFLWQRLQQPPIGAWVADLARKSGATEVVVHFHNAWASGTFLPIRTPSGIRVRVVATFHGVNLGLASKPVRALAHRWMAKRLLRFGAQLTSVDAFSLGLAERLLGIKPACFSVIHNGTNGTPSPTGSAWDGTGEFVVGCLGAVSEIKGWRLTAEAVLALAAQGKRIRLIIAGTGPLQEQARRLAEIHTGVIEYRGHVEAPRKNFFPSVNLLSMMSGHEGLPMSLIEAMAAGVPVLATKVGGIPEALIDGVTGLLVPRSAVALVEALSSLLNRPDKLASMGVSARKEFEKRFEIQEIAGQYHALYFPVSPPHNRTHNAHRGPI